VSSVPRSAEYMSTAPICSGPTRSGSANTELTPSSAMVDAKPGQRERDSRMSWARTGDAVRIASQHGPSPRSNCTSSSRAARASLAEMVSLPSSGPSVEIEAPVTAKRSTKKSGHSGEGPGAERTRWSVSSNDWSTGHPSFFPE
jgi:hypothetical protein